MNENTEIEYFVITLKKSIEGITIELSLLKTKRSFYNDGKLSEASTLLLRKLKKGCLSKND